MWPWHFVRQRAQYSVQWGVARREVCLYSLIHADEFALPPRRKLAAHSAGSRQQCVQFPLCAVGEWAEQTAADHDRQRLLRERRGASDFSASSRIADDQKQVFFDRETEHGEEEIHVSSLLCCIVSQTSFDPHRFFFVCWLLSLWNTRYASNFYFIDRHASSPVDNHWKHGRGLLQFLLLSGIALHRSHSSPFLT